MRPMPAFFKKEPRLEAPVGANRENGTDHGMDARTAGTLYLIRNL